MSNLKIQEIRNYTLLRLENNEMGVNLLREGWTISFNKRLTRAIGRCNYGKKLIEMSLHFIPTLKEHEWKDVVNHEIAHALTQGSGHNTHWRNIASALGAIPRATKKLEELPKSKEPKYVVYFKNARGEYELLKKYFKKPSRSFKGSYVTGRKAETAGKLKVTSYQNFVEMSK